MKILTVLSLSIFIHLGMSGTAFAENGDTNAKQRTESDITRDKSSKPYKIMEFLGIKKGEQVLDFLGGAGYYSQLLAAKVGPTGKVVLHNNQAYMEYIGKQLEQRITNGGLDRVTRLLSEADDLKFGNEQFDSAILVLAYHDFLYKDKGWDFSPDIVIPQLRKSLKKGGKLLIIDHAAAEGSGISVAKSLHRIEPSFVKQDIVKRGFKFVKESKVLSNDKDQMDIIVFDPKIRRQTNRFVYLFEKY